MLSSPGEKRKKKRQEKKRKKKHHYSPRVPERRRADQEVGPRARDEPERVVAVLRVLPEVRVRVVEDVRAQVRVVERLFFFFQVEFFLVL